MSVKALFPYELYPKILMCLEMERKQAAHSFTEGRGGSESVQKTGGDEAFVGPSGLLGWLGCGAGLTVRFINLLAHSCTSLNPLPAAQS